MTAQLKTYPAHDENRPSSFDIISPINGQVFETRAYASSTHVNEVVSQAKKSQKKWSKLTLDERSSICLKALAYFEKNKEKISQEITYMMGRPSTQSPGEIAGFLERAHEMIRLADEGLSNIELPKKNGFKRFIAREPLGVILSIPAWNYPYLTAVNSIIPALMAGNAVIIKHSAQTALCSEHFVQAFEEAGLDQGVINYLHLTHQQTSKLIQSGNIDFVSFTGSVQGGRQIQKAISEAQYFPGSTLELGGKDPAYVDDDCDFEYAVTSLVDGSFYNSGQSCCGIERIYVHQNIFDDFVSRFVEETNKYVLGSPLDPQTTLGPMVRTQAAENVMKQIQQAVDQGAKTHINISDFPAHQEGTPYLAPQVLTNVNHNMSIMTEETFGPVACIQSVKSSDEAVELMNDSSYGLTASLWMRDLDKASLIAQTIETGTVFMNRCDYLDPSLAWVGVKNTGRGCSLSQIGYENLTRPKSYHMLYKTSDNKE